MSCRAMCSYNEVVVEGRVHLGVVKVEMAVEVVLLKVADQQVAIQEEDLEA